MPPLARLGRAGLCHRRRHGGRERRDDYGRGRAEPPSRHRRNPVADAATGGAGEGRRMGWRVGMREEGGRERGAAAG